MSSTRVVEQLLNTNPLPLDLPRKADRFWDWDLQSGRVRVTRASAVGAAFESAEIQSSISEWEASVHPDDRARVARELADYLARRVPSFQSEYRIRREDSEWGWVRDGGIAVWDKSGRALRMSGVETDISRYKLENAELGGRLSRLTAVFASLAEGLLILDLEGKVVESNASAERILGLTREQISGRTPRDPLWRALREDGTLFPDEERPSLVTLRTGEPRSGVIMGIHTPDGTQRWVSVNTHALRNVEGIAVAGVVVSFADITEMRRMTERLLEAQKLESVARLAGGIAHDFNNLLTAVLSYAELGLKQVEPASTLATYLEKIIASGDRAAGLTRQLLAFSRRQPARPTRIDLGELLAASLDILRPWVGERIVVQLDCASDLWPVLADRGQLQQVLLNLASNASDAMAGLGSLRLVVRNIVLHEAQDLASGDYVEWKVIDSGAGMTTEVQAHGFEPFFTTKEIGAGSGLGLATCYGLVRQHRGSIRVQSAPGKGTTITILLPRALAGVAPN